MKILLHICCGPCAIMPLQRLLEEGHTVTGYFYNPNIHPLAEYLRRREGAAQVAARYAIDMIWAVRPEDYDTVAWLAAQRTRSGGMERCRFCLARRLEKTCREARAGGFDAFCTSLLYSRHQQHEFIAECGASLSEAGVDEASRCVEPLRFFYRDFRPDWQEGIDRSKDWSIYRQQYCGCIFSENERYAGELEKENAKLEKVMTGRHV